VTLVLLGSLALGSSAARAADWRGDLSPISEAEWSYARAAHLMERAGFGGSPDDVESLYRLGPERAVRHLVYFEGVPERDVPAFEHSGIFEPGLDPFPSSRPATTRLAEQTGEALGVAVKAGGDRPVQPVVNRFFYWLRASRLEADRVAYWWAERMLTSNRPLQEKMALFWHGHFATNEDKVRDYRKMLKQLQLFRRAGLGNFRELLIGVAQDPAMLAFLDAGVNIKDAPNENFAREIMELFTMGVGHYSEFDVREAARAFTGWNYRGLDFHINEEQHDSGEKQVLGQRGNFDGVQVIDLILAEDVTAAFIAGKLYRFFVSEDMKPAVQAQLGQRLRSLDYELRPFLTELFLSRDFYATAGDRIKPPVELVISTYRKLALGQVPGIPDFNQVTDSLGQRLLHPPTVAGWAGGRSWITPGLLFERGNFVLDVVFPDIAFIAPDRYPTRTPNILPVHEGLRAGKTISQATLPPGMESGGEMMAASNLMADRDEAFNTRYGSYRGWQMAIERVQPIPRHTARLDLTAMVLGGGAQTTQDAVTLLVQRFFSVAPDPAIQGELAAFLRNSLGTDDLQAAASYLEEPLRTLLHLLMSQPEYQLG
jgi:uncharacterized protein (DUF1800 family)